jgi:hypothetical protein
MRPSQKRRNPLYHEKRCDARWDRRGRLRRRGSRGLCNVHTSGPVSGRHSVGASGGYEFAWVDLIVDGGRAGDLQQHLLRYRVHCAGRSHRLGLGRYRELWPFRRGTKLVRLYAWNLPGTLVRHGGLDSRRCRRVAPARWTDDSVGSRRLEEALLSTMRMLAWLSRSRRKSRRIREELRRKSSKTVG